MGSCEEWKQPHHKKRVFSQQNQNSMSFICRVWNALCDNKLHLGIFPRLEEAKPTSPLLQFSNYNAASYKIHGKRGVGNSNQQPLGWKSAAGCRRFRSHGTLRSVRFSRHTHFIFLTHLRFRVVRTRRRGQGGENKLTRSVVARVSNQNRICNTGLWKLKAFIVVIYIYFSFISQRDFSLGIMMVIK